VRARDSTNFPLSLRAYRSDRLGFDLGYDPNLFDRATMAVLADRLLILLAGIATAAHRPVRELPWMTAAERARILAWGGSRPAEEPVGRLDGSLDGLAGLTLVHRFEAQAAATPAAIAVTGAGEQLSYAELN